jgi:hypothetical protein
MKTFLFLAIFLVLLPCSIVAQAEGVNFTHGVLERVKASTIIWKGPFAYRKEEPQNVYLLMTQGALRAPISPDFEDLVKSWIYKHPNAEATMIYSMDRGQTSDSKFKTVWITDGDENLNIYIVRIGGCPAGTMVLNRGDDTPLTRDAYEAFEKAVWEAEKLAKIAHVGIWKDPGTKSPE